MYILKCHSQVG